MEEGLETEDNPTENDLRDWFVAGDFYVLKPPKKNVAIFCHTFNSKNFESLGRFVNARMFVMTWQSILFGN